MFSDAIDENNWSCTANKWNRVLLSYVGAKMAVAYWDEYWITAELLSSKTTDLIQLILFIGGLKCYTFWSRVKQRMTVRGYWFLLNILIFHLVENAIRFAVSLQQVTSSISNAFGQLISGTATIAGTVHSLLIQVVQSVMLSNPASWSTKLHSTLFLHTYNYLGKCEHHCLLHFPQSPAISKNPPIIHQFSTVCTLLL